MSQKENILAIHSGHDASVCLWNDYNQIAIYKEERLNRKKNWGQAFPLLSFNKIKDHISIKDIDILILSRGYFENKFYYKNALYGKKISRIILYLYLLLGIRKSSSLNGLLYLNQTDDEKKVFNQNKFIQEFGFKKNIKIIFSDHHYAHALPMLFFNPNWNNALLYTSDGGGDGINYSFTYFNEKKFKKIYGYSDLLREDFKPDSLGQMYSMVTKLCGFTPNRHEGKITGLAAFGEPKYKDTITSLYEIDDIGRIIPKFKSYRTLYEILNDIFKKDGREIISASAQSALEELTVKSIKKIKSNYNFTNIGLAGGVCSNVKLNQCISEINGIEDMFVFPPMGDEGLCVGYILDYLLQRDGNEVWLGNRRELEHVYWGDEYSISKEDLPKGIRIYNESSVLETSVKLLKKDKVCAIFTNRMEYGPRALGARSILINSRNKEINETVNQRLDRTEFMPFAPYVMEEYVDEVFKVTKSQRKALKFMTVTVDTKEEWKDKIQATVHVDGTARPQTINKSQNKFYYEILELFYKETGIPCLVNTSFNAHEEPIINKPSEAFKALVDNRVDYLIFENMILVKE